ncbi:TonB-dependent receptor [Pontibacter harenae]|uniref:TonB-dependent receptor n=1 Tax=Pontibacter harenae TaxID=2894083 RepID=UPI001E650007|nr:TonB-dependent receptor [Pontibacter harenae]MCC9167994.1 TonB-dependent receptor [Pontibacter harenae]
MKCKLILLIVALFSLSFSHAQTTDTLQNNVSAKFRLHGKITDDKGTPLSFVNVVLLKAVDSSLATTTLTNDEGKFELTVPDAGRYFIKYISLGFIEKRTEAMDISNSEKAIDLGVTILKTDSKTLQTVDVTALRPTITMEADKMVVSVEGTAMAAGNTAFSVLSRAPGVFVDGEGNIQLNGKGGVTVMIDGKLTYLSAQDLRTMLESMPAENLKNIEVITNPSSKYDAEGTSGILNLNLKKNTLQGTNGFVQTAYNYNFRQQHGGSVSGRINHKSGNWNSFVSTDFSRRVGGRDATFTRIFYGERETIYFDQTAEGNHLIQGPPTVRMGTDYNLNDNHSIGVMGSFVKNRVEQDFLTQTYIGNEPGNPSQFIDADNISSNTYSNISTNLHYTGKLDTLGTMLTSDFDYVRIWNRGHTNMDNYYTNVATGEQTTDLLYSNTPSNFDIYSGKVDFTLPINKVYKVELGTKASQVTSDNDFDFYFNNDALVLDPQRTNHFRYKESIYAGYLNWSGPVTKNISVQGGLRVEHTASIANLITTGDVTKRNYTDLFPSLFIQQNVSENYTINYNYTRRLNRPSYGSLNVFKAYRDPFTYYQGNPYLRPQYTHAFSVTQMFKSKYIVTFKYNIFKDALEEVPTLDVEEGVTVYTTGNLNSGTEYGLTAVAPFKIMNKWDSQNTLTLFNNRNTFQSNLGEIVNEQFLVSLQSLHTIQLPKDFRTELNLLVRGPQANGLYRMAPVYRVDFALKKSFMDSKIDLALNVVDVFESFRFLWAADIAGNVSDFDQYFRVRTISLSLRYNFSRGQKVEQKRRSSGPEEVNRTN